MSATIPSGMRRRDISFTREPGAFLDGYNLRTGWTQVPEDTLGGS